MGTSIYGVRSREKVVKLRNGGTLTVRNMSFAYKASYGFSDEPYTAACLRTENAIERAYRKKGVADYVIYIDDFTAKSLFAKTGAFPVIKWGRHEATNANVSDPIEIVTYVRAVWVGRAIDLYEISAAEYDDIMIRADREKVRAGTMRFGEADDDSIDANLDVFERRVKDAIAARGFYAAVATATR